MHRDELSESDLAKIEKIEIKCDNECLCDPSEEELGFSKRVDNDKDERKEEKVVDDNDILKLFKDARELYL